MSDYYYGTILPSPSITDSNEAENVEYYYTTIDATTGGTSWNIVTNSEVLDTGTYYMYAVIPETTHYYAKTTGTKMFKVLMGEPKDPTVENKVYNGKLQTGVYGGTGVSLSGVTEAIEVGTYVAFGDVEKNYAWPSNYEGTREYTWQILPRPIAETKITLNHLVIEQD